MNNFEQQSPQMNPAQLLQESSPIYCSECSGRFFTPSFVLRKISGLALGTGNQEHIVPLQLFRCADCGTPHMPAGAPDILSDDSTPSNNSDLIMPN